MAAPEMISSGSDLQRAGAAVADAPLKTRASALVNPASGLANDYLNLFNEIVMLIEQLPSMPELIDDIFAWRPTSYQDYFTRSILPGRGSALEAYAALSQTFRRDFEALVGELDRMAVGAIAAIRRHHKTKGNTEPYTLAGLCTRSGEKMREVLDRATKLVNYGPSDGGETAQAVADRVMLAN
ncbi:MAG: hypothetical protein QOC72_48 [Methylobacteriaceae bacterium]|jgi:hypothetical protein|nr:hypothetical protein [Methylobacteriaceae bacterium]